MSLSLFDTKTPPPRNGSHPVQPQTGEFGLGLCSNVALFSPRELVRRFGKTLVIDVLGASCGIQANANVDELKTRRKILSGCCITALFLPKAFRESLMYK